VPVVLGPHPFEHNAVIRCAKVTERNDGVDRQDAREQSCKRVGIVDERSTSASVGGRSFQATSSSLTRSTKEGGEVVVMMR
jgi:hypothetical protein